MKKILILLSIILIIVSTVLLILDFVYYKNIGSIIYHIFLIVWNIGNLVVTSIFIKE